MGYIDDIEEKSKENGSFRKVLYTGKHMQLVVMSLKPGEDIGEEVHDHVDQFFRIEEGECTVVIDGNESVVKEDMVAIVPAGSMHNVINTGDVDLKLYTIYSPPNHPENTEHVTREEAMLAEEEEHHH